MKDWRDDGPLTGPEQHYCKSKYNLCLNNCCSFAQQFYHGAESRPGKNLKNQSEDITTPL